MTITPPRRLGVMFDRARPPEQLAGFARDLEQAGFDEIWVVEDLGWGGAMSSAATALAATGSITVGIGIVPAPLRNVAVLAMELATLERLHPGRLLAGIGHGVTPWMRQVGAAVESPLTLLEETFRATRALLRGEFVDAHGRYVTVDGVRLVHPPAAVPPLLAGVMKPRSLALAGRVADGTILAEGTGPSVIAAARQHISAASEHSLTVLTHVCIESDEQALAAATADVRAEFAEVQGVAPAQVYLADGPASVAAQKVSALWDAGADSVVLRPIGDRPLATVLALRAALTG
ncbi:Flavin-dependent oxidoreductase, luciferase family (includes alkanesulfonate monooxygenase SsuD and methylene tetrahydromethanopterin reductase) [Nakamurella panacisegetis]|uniref:Flavin-dependent oxidoreductase, luciferase family (Includes alkanesulfonate monooxygenase SsuD and methylene tetrahydromethanopterin reductase) n=1 Tax=Nakamurella panacisegetis TaxID=1090615 RepID=A0A1H0MU38_9ACTN|nr:LLM class flavin-dependent oxidoreductase [Nakamurella panacisegetis]SDO83815.1 Flavin-dependent oxidoreductase, luciferase family (includes alkanesulfonate monooxygenase SsuD and methylene tetrahydromethanopterin reductase) [Nakamurella panacisegetis]